MKRNIREGRGSRAIGRSGDRVINQENRAIGRSGKETCASPRDGSTPILRSRRFPFPVSRFPTPFLVAVLALSSFACSRSGPKAVRVGSKNFSEQVLLGEIVAQALEARGVSVSRKLDLGGTFVCHAALVSDELDRYPEYTGTAYTAILHEKPDSDPAAVRLRVAEAYRKRWNLVWAPPLGFENTFALVVRREDAQRLGLRTISDLAARGESPDPP